MLEFLEDLGILMSAGYLSNLLDQHLDQLSFGYRSRVLEAAAIAFYHQQSNWPVVPTLVCDDAPQFKLLTEELALCWVHEGRQWDERKGLTAAKISELLLVERAS